MSEDDNDCKVLILSKGYMFGLIASFIDFASVKPKSKIDGGSMSTRWWREIICPW
jgi:hypothetical protein